MSGTIEEEDTPVYPASLLSSLDLSQSPATFSPPLTIHQPGQDLRIRPLHIQVSVGYRVGHFLCIDPISTLPELRYMLVSG